MPDRAITLYATFISRYFAVGRVSRFTDGDEDLTSYISSCVPLPAAVLATKRSPDLSDLYEKVDVEGPGEQDAQDTRKERISLFVIDLFDAYVYDTDSPFLTSERTSPSTSNTDRIFEDLASAARDVFRQDPAYLTKTVNDLLSRYAHLVKDNDAVNSDLEECVLQYRRAKKDVMVETLLRRSSPANLEKERGQGSVFGIMNVVIEDDTSNVWRRATAIVLMTPDRKAYAPGFACQFRLSRESVYDSVSYIRDPFGESPALAVLARQFFESVCTPPVSSSIGNWSKGKNNIRRILVADRFTCKRINWSYTSEHRVKVDWDSLLDVVDRPS